MQCWRACFSLANAQSVEFTNQFSYWGLKKKQGKLQPKCFFVFFFWGLFLGDCKEHEVMIFLSRCLSTYLEWQNKFWEERISHIYWKRIQHIQETGQQTSFLVFTKTCNKVVKPVAVYSLHIVSPSLILQGNY